MRGKWFLFAILALPALELLTLIIVSRFVGFGTALLMLLGISCAGLLLFRYQRSVSQQGIRIKTEGRSFSSIDLSEAGLHRWGSAILLIVPGFITGALGVLLLIPAFRQFMAGRLKPLFAPPAAANPDIVDLPPEEWHVVPDKQIGQRR